MKKQVLLIVALACTAMAFAQPGGGMRRTVEERVQIAHQKIDSAFKPEAVKMQGIDSVFAKYYRATDKLREDMMSGGDRPDFQAMRDKMVPLTEDRDKELKILLGEANFKIFKDAVEPALMPRRGGGGGGGRN